MKQILYLFVFLTVASCATSRPGNKPTSADCNLHLLGENNYQIKTVGILLYDGFTTLDAMGPYQVFSELIGTEVFFVAKSKGLVRNMNGLPVQVDRGFSDTGHLDILVVPGGLRETYKLTKDPETIAWIKKVDNTSEFTASICTGAWIVGAAGLLKWKNATTHWYRAEEMLAKYGANYKEQRWVRDGKYWTSAGVTAGMDMCLDMVREINGDKYLRMVLLDLEYNPKPPLKGGSVRATEKESVKMLQELYGSQIIPLLESEKE